MRLAAIGVNFIDVYQRSGLYKMSPPFIAGNEGAGIVETTGSDAGEIAAGDRVAFANVPGAYAEFAVVPADRLVVVPAGLDCKLAAALMLQGMTAHYLTHSTYPVRQGDHCLVHAAAGGVGELLVQLCKRRGAVVYGTVSTPAKASRAQEVGADEVIQYTAEDFEAGIRQLTAGRGAEVVYDGVGRATFEKSLCCLAVRGYLVLFGQSSGPVAPLDPQVLNAKGSVFLTRPSLGHYIRTRQELLWRANDILNWAATNQLQVQISAELPLSQAAEAHRLLESRQTIGKVLLIP